MPALHLKGWLDIEGAFNMTIQTIIALSIGTCAMLVLIAILMLCYRVRLWKSVPVTILLTITGTLGTYIWFFVENSNFSGRSYYGAVFLVPVGFWYVAKIMRIPYGKLMDFCAPAECVMLAIMKYQCFTEGCCGGIFLPMLGNGKIVIFPSQIVELICALMIMAILMGMGISRKFDGKIYPWYMTIYGGVRFVVNFFREDQTPLLMGLPAGALWSLVSIFVGILWLTNRRIVIEKCDLKIENP